MLGTDSRLVFGHWRAQRAMLLLAGALGLGVLFGACGGDGTSPSGGGPPAAPQGLSAIQNPAQGSIDLIWLSVTGATGYNIYRSTTPGVSPSTGTKIPWQFGARYPDTGLTPGTTYYYVVTATSPGGESPPSLEARATATGTIAMDLVGPVPGDLVDVTMPIAVIITSTFALTSVTAQVGGNSIPLGYVAARSRWEGVLSLAALPSPSLQVFTVTASDMAGGTAEMTIAVRDDHPPQIAVASPQDNDAATPSIHLQATCSDDAQCLSLQAYVLNGPLLATGQSTIDQTVSLAAFDGQNEGLVFVATDSSGQRTQVQRTNIAVEASPHLTVVASAGTGTLIDASADRLLALSQASAGDTLRLIDRGTSAALQTFVLPGTAVRSAGLTSTGAVFLAGSTLYEWRNGALSTLTTGGPIQELVVKGDWAIWTEGMVGSDTLFRRDLLAGTNLVVTDSSAIAGNDVAPNGDVAYSSPHYDVYLYHAGTTTRLTTDSGVVWANVSPVTDGTHVVYAKYHVPAPPYQIGLFDPGGEIVLTPSQTAVPEAGSDYQVAGGWEAFTRPDLTGVHQVWVRSAAGAESQVSIFGSSSRIELLGASGEVVFATVGVGGRRYRAPSAGPPQDISSSLGQPIYIAGQLHVMLRAVLFGVN